MRIFTYTMLSTIFFLTCENLLAQVGVRLGTYEKKVPSGYFEDAGIEGVELIIDRNDIHHYYLSENFKIKTDAEKTRQNVIKKGFPYARIIDIADLKTRCAKWYNNSIQSKSDSFKLNPIYFEFNQATLNQAAYGELNKLQEILHQNPEYSVQLMGHTDSKGSARYNIKLSAQRALAIRQYLKEKGIDQKRVRIKVFGESAPLAINRDKWGNDSPAGRFYNRRVNIFIIKENGQYLKHYNNEVPILPHLRIHPEKSPQLPEIASKVN